MCAIVIYIDLTQLVARIILPLFYNNFKASNFDILILSGIAYFVGFCLINRIIINNFRFNSAILGLVHSQSLGIGISHSENTNAIFQILIQFCKKCIMCIFCSTGGLPATVYRVKEPITKCNTTCTFRRLCGCIPASDFLVVCSTILQVTFRLTLYGFPSLTYYFTAASCAVLLFIIFVDLSIVFQ